VKTFSNRYIFIFSSVMVIIVAAILSFIAIQLQPLQEKNILLEKKMSILKAMNIQTTKDEAEDKYDKYIVNSYTVNHQGEKTGNADAFGINFKEELDKQEEERRYPVYIGQTEKSKKVYIFPLHGKGLWGPVYGYISLKSDMKTVYGVIFDHDDETPGLGAEINTDEFQEQFQGKQIFDDAGVYVGIEIVKGGTAPDNSNAVDALSGATITSDGVEAMIYTCLGYYKPFIKKVNNE
jgi:Na+-transporting NADH:ubiquinone oxidoreductase subunit C